MGADNRRQQGDSDEEIQKLDPAMRAAVNIKGAKLTADSSTNALLSKPSQPLTDKKKEHIVEHCTRPSVYPDMRIKKNAIYNHVRPALLSATFL